MKRICLNILLCSVFVTGIYTQWLPDLKLTTIVNYTYSLMNNSKQVAAYGNTVHTVWYDRPDGNYEIYYRRSSDAGASWGQTIRLTNAASNSEGPGIIAVGDFVHVAWQDLRDGDWSIYYKRSTDGGLSWGADQRLSDQPSNGFDPCLAGTGNLLHVVWQDSRNGVTQNGYETYYKRSTDAGVTWGPDIRMTNNITNTLYPSISVSGEFVHIVWYDTPASQQATYYMRSTDGGLTFNTEIRLSSNAGASNWPCISASGEFVHVVWLDTRDGNYEIYYKRSSDNGISWSADTRLTNSAPNSWYPSVASFGGIVHVAWWDQINIPVGNNEIYYKRSTDAGASWETDIRLTNDDSYSRYTSVTASGQGAHVVWCDYRDGIGIWYKNNPIGNTIAAVDSVSPKNKVNALLNSDMKAYFNQNMNASTMDSSSITFFGSMTGRKQGIFAYNYGDRSVTINPQYDFKYGELISTILKPSIKTGTDNFITPFVWSFTTTVKQSNLVFGQADTIGVGNNVAGITTGDFDHDGYIDLAVPYSSSNQVVILRNNGNGTFAVSSNIGITGWGSRSIASGDFDNDGYLDLAVPLQSANTVSILKNNSNGTFTVSSNVSVSSYSNSITTGDFDGDGYLDIAIPDNYTQSVFILRNNGSGVFTVSSSIAVGNNASGIVTGDFNGDGFLDLAATGSGASILMNNSNGTFTVSSVVETGGNSKITTGDFDSDGFLDLAATAGPPMGIKILKNNGSGIFTESSSIWLGGGLQSITAGDLNGDGYLDLSVTDYNLNTVLILKNNGSGVFTESSSIGVGNYPWGIVTGDFNNDGVLDIANANYNSQNITVLMNLLPPGLLSPANNSIGNSIALNFAWNKSRGAGNYRFQLATDSLFSNLLVNDSALTGTDSTKSVSGLNALTWYYWRLNSKSANGTSLWSEAWKFKTIGLPLQVTLISPPNNAVNQPISISFRWSRALEQMSPIEGKRNLGTKDNEHDAISNYWFEIVTDTISMTNLLRDTTLTDTTKIVSGLVNLTNYFWRVKAKSELGWGNYSGWFRFTTIISAPSAPVLVNPANGAIGQNITLTLIWNKLPAAETYRLQVSTDSLFNVLIVNDSTLTDTTRVISGLNPLTYYWWRVNAKNIGGTGIHSNVWKFKTMGAPTQVTLITPPNNATNQAINLNFVWSRSTDLLAPWLNVNKNGEILNDNESISSYWFDIVTDTSSLANLLRDTTLTDTIRTVNGLNYSTAYYWRVKAKNQIGWGAYSVWFKFTTSPPPPAIVNLTVIPGGFYDVGSGRLNMKDTIRVFLVDSVSCLRVDSAKGVIDSVTYSMPISFSNAATGSYYMMVYHRNHLAIASRYSQGIVRGSTVNYDFTTDSTKTFGFNVIKVSTSPVRWAMIPGDGNRDGFVDATDQLVWINLNGLDGYLDADFNGDSFVDATDQLIWITYNGTSVFLPCGFIMDPQTLNPVKNTSDYDAKKSNRMLFERKKQDEKNGTDMKKDNLK